ncbi:MAG: hemerythrin domain-containing protein [Candidatus Symbiobacter sp.]|nr:hemerythrin domain-containing protein [Candidatus Symbiobacter sp.]
MDMSKFHSQHMDAATQLTALEGILGKGQIDPVEASEALIVLASRLNFHLSMEDKFLYPKAAQSHDAELRDLAQKMQTEMAGLSEEFTRYVKKWSPNEIKADTQEFVSHSHRVVNALKDRIHREENFFYPMVQAKL